MAKSGVLTLIGRKTGRSQAVTIVVVMLAAVVTLIGGVAIWLHFFIAGNCGE